ncbi:MAG: CxxxxCH/CxxCH domain-containing protein [Geobacteraceae bacterium]|nr:CxxxxCH/CxxCH domain-containing protein [Geobacteraceae bacterium]
MIPLLLICPLILATYGTLHAAAQCYDCHGSKSGQDYRPLDDAFRNRSSGGFQGNHRTHLQSSARAADCAPCHPGSSGYNSSHRNGVIELSNRINSSPLAAGYRSGMTAIPQTTTPALGNCSNVNCHFESDTLTWGSLPLSRNSCSSCHQTPPTDGAHGKKHGLYYGTDQASCTKCHPDHQSNLDHALESGKRPLNVQFSGTNMQGRYTSGSTGYPNYLPSQNPARNGTCTAIYCHSDGRGGPPTIAPRWSDPNSTKCFSCHKGASGDSTQANCVSIQGAWSSARNICTPDVTMSSNGHHRLVGPQWIRKYPCTYCHNQSVAEVFDANGKITGDGGIRFVNFSTRHVNGTVNVAIASQWNVVGLPPASFNSTTKACTNLYCHSDGTAIPEDIRQIGWSEKTDCNSCHGHPRGTCNTVLCHDGRTDSNGKTWAVLTGWPAGSEWMGAMPMFLNEGQGTAHANSHARHIQTNMTCDNCHAKTVVNGTCTVCHTTGIPSGTMSEVAHVNPEKHVNKRKDVDFKDGGTYDENTKKCSSTACHIGVDPVWGGSVNTIIICISCHKTTTATGGDVDSYGFAANTTRAKINLDEWSFSGHGRYSSAALTGKYPVSGNPAAGFPIDNPCWYCHDNSVLHNDATNPFRLRQHDQFSKRFDKECVYCHMQGYDSECLGCHNSVESLSPQLKSSIVITKHSGVTYLSGCTVSSCHDSDAKMHKSGVTSFWTADQKTDVKNQYVMMGVCLKCHDDDSANQCNGCHDYSLPKYQLGFDPGTGFRKPKKARASSAHFGMKHYAGFLSSGGWELDSNGHTKGIWRGGKFCWDCHDPHGDSNIYMIHDKVATTTDGKFGIPLTRATVVFTKKQSGSDYANSDPFKPYNGICNVCHTAASRHYTATRGDGHNSGRICTDCHQHRFADSHANGNPCNSCHANSKPVPKHAAFGLPQDCTKCHSGIINKRMDIMGQFNGNSHHIQGVAVTNKQCYKCHWEATAEGFIDRKYHEGYDYKVYTSVPNAKVDLVIWQAGVRPTFYSSTTAVQFLAKNVGTSGERAEAAKVTNHCLGCHSDQNNNTDPFGDCKTPRQYAWDFQSVAARYSQIGTTQWGKVNSTAYPNANQKDTVTKAFSAHGNAANNQGGYSLTSGTDSSIPNLRGSQNVQCYDCHSSHGSKVTGVTSSYMTFNGTYNGANLKETQAGKGGYGMSYRASANTTSGAINPYNAGAGQCFDCHNSQNSGTTPWGYQSTFGATAPVSGYNDSLRFGVTGSSPSQYAYKRNRPAVGGHMKAESFLNRTTSAQNKINGLCTPCHDPHGVSPTLGSKQAYAIPLLKGTWMTSPYREDAAMPVNGGYVGPPNLDPAPLAFTDQRSFDGNRISQSDSQFAGLCLRCHNKSTLTKDACSNPAFNNNSSQCKSSGATWRPNSWKSKDRVHESVRDWKSSNNKIQHSYTCSKCHAPHSGNMPRLLVTNCFDWKHRGQQQSGGSYPADGNSNYWDPGGPDGSENGPGSGGGQMPDCHPGAWPDNSWNVVTPW